MVAESITQSQDILLIRHGEYQSVRPPYYLTAHGIEQSRATGRRLHTLFASNAIRSSKIIHSGIMQARQTAQEICTHIRDPELELKEDILLNEGHPVAVISYRYKRTKSC